MPISADLLAPHADVVFDLVDERRSPCWPRYRVLPDGSAEALLITDLDARGATVVREDGGPTVGFVPIAADDLAALVGDAPLPLPASPGVARVEIAFPATSYRIALGDDAPGADPFNADSPGGLVSLLTHPHAPRSGLDGVDLWRPDSADSVEEAAESSRPQRIRLDRGVLGRRATMHLSAPRRPAADGIVPVVLLLDGDDWLHLYPLSSALAAAAAGSAEWVSVLDSVALAYLPAPLDRSAREDELTSAAMASAVATSVLVAVDADLLGRGLHRGYTVLAAQSLGGVAAVRAAVVAAGAGSAVRGIDAVVAQSPSFWWPAPAMGGPLDGPDGGAVLEELGGDTLDLSSPALSFRFTVGSGEPAMHRHVDAVRTALTDRGARATMRVIDGGHDHAVWRLALVRDLCDELITAH
ncbi:putative esterase [Gordonia polyisoprenivorans VH2]|uniref:Putative esterase n=1 Tax=Gordonia polyisoprenivorans (strain DSM 44266 / VH2) TaxID=1112204 RepID=H6MVZ8_GORPV|nr:alpha/beta hydrolase-fold protein [Gordonia polyisoprenivorans]AFA71693.1 putative esterase [Gordonia polyisoprenivorans VH2]